MHKVHWIAGLSNGETAHEEKGNFQTIEGELSPWQRLLAYMKENELEIRSLSLGTDDGKRWNLPSASANPKFHAFASAPKPVSFRMFRQIGRDVLTGEQDLYTCIEAQYEDGHALQTWVDEDHPDVCWSLFI